MIEQTLVAIKPDGIQRALIGKIISRFEDAGLKIIGMKMQWIDEKFAEEHYSEDLIEILGQKSKKSYEEQGLKFTEDITKKGKEIRKALIKYITEGPIIAMVLEGVNTISIVRKIVGSTGPYDASPGTIRGDYAHIAISYANINKKQVRNLIHASADKKDAEREIKLWFSKKELHSYKRADEDHLT